MKFVGDFQVRVFGTSIVLKSLGVMKFVGDFQVRVFGTSIVLKSLGVMKFVGDFQVDICLDLAIVLFNIDFLPRNDYTTGPIHKSV